MQGQVAFPSGRVLRPERAAELLLKVMGGLRPYPRTIIMRRRSQSQSPLSLTRPQAIRHRLQARCDHLNSTQTVDQPLQELSARMSRHPRGSQERRPSRQTLTQRKKQRTAQVTLSLSRRPRHQAAELGQLKQHAARVRKRSGIRFGSSSRNRKQSPKSTTA